MFTFIALFLPYLSTAFIDGIGALVMGASTYEVRSEATSLSATHPNCPRLRLPVSPKVAWNLAENRQP